MTWEPTKFVDSHKVTLALTQSRGDFYNGMNFEQWMGWRWQDLEIDFE